MRLGVVAKEGQDGDYGRGVDVEGELVLYYGELLDELGEARDNVGAVVVETGVDFRVLVDGVGAG